MLSCSELIFIGITWSKSGLFSTPGFLVSPVGKREWGEKRREGGKKEIEKEERKGGGKKE